MTHVLAFAAFLLLPLIGIGIWRLDAVARMPPGARIAVAGAAGMVVTGALFGVLSIIGISWSRTTVLPIVAATIAAGFYAKRRSPAAPPAPKRHAIATAGMLVVLLLTGYGLVTARQSCGDLHFFWGPKAIHFHHDGGVTKTFLTDESASSMNPGYPLLLPMIYSWSLTLSREFSFMAAILATALFLFGSVLLLRDTSGDDYGALLMAATLSYAIAIASAAGAGETPLLFFETVTLVALLFVKEPRGQSILAALGLAGAVMLKIEGATFAIAVVLALIVVRRSLRQAALIAAPAALLIVSWLWFVKANGIMEYYRGAAMPLYLKSVPEVMRLLVQVASYDLFWLPWLVPALLIALSPARRAALLPLLVALLTFGATVFYYVHVEDPKWWILSSASRVLLTPLTALLIAVVAARVSPDSARA